jgi:hypothetical protein
MRIRATALLAALALVVGLAACGSDGNDDAKATTTTAAKTTTTTESKSDSSSTTEAGSSTTVSIPSEKPNAAFCDGYNTISKAGEPPNSLEGIQTYYDKTQAAIEKMRDNAPEDLQDGLTQGADLLKRANARIQAADSVEALQKDKELEKIFQTDLSLANVEAYGKKYC